MTLIIYSPLAVNLNGCIGSFNTLNDLSNRFPEKMEDLNLQSFNIITEIDVSETLIKYLLCKCKCEIDGKKCNSNQKWI